MLTQFSAAVVSQIWDCASAPCDLRRFEGHGDVFLQPARHGVKPASPPQPQRLANPLRALHLSCNGGWLK